MFRRTIAIDLPTADEALPGRQGSMPTADRHAVLHTPLHPPWPTHLRVAICAMGCFWGAERLFWQAPGVYSTAVGYTGGITPNPTYDEVRTGWTGHAEAVQIVFDPEKIFYRQLLTIFWENHDPTQGMRQGNDCGTMYRSALYVTDPTQRNIAQASRDAFAPIVQRAGLGEITTEITEAGPFYYAEDYHQQYLSPTKNPHGYCAHGPTGLVCDLSSPDIG